MALPVIGLKLSDVISHLSTAGAGTFTKLSECISAFNATGANGSYYTAPCNSLKDFRGYQHPPAGVTVSPITLIGDGKSSGTFACSAGFPETTRYTDGNPAGVSSGDYIYIDNPGVTPFNGANQYFAYAGFGGTQWMRVSSSGEVIGIGICKGGGPV